MGGQIEGWIDTRWIQKGRCRTQGGWRPAAVVNIRAGARREYIIARAPAYATCMNRFLVLNTVCMHAPLAIHAPLSMYTYAVCVSSVCMPRSLCVPMQYVHSHVFERGAGAGVERAGAVAAVQDSHSPAHGDGVAGLYVAAPGSRRCGELRRR